MRVMDGRVAVVGTGTLGSMALWRMSLHTPDVVGFDARYPAHDRTASGGDTRLFRVAYREGAQYSRLLYRSEALLRELNDSGVPAFLQVGGLTIGSREGALVNELIASADSAGTAYTVLSRAEMRDRYPQHTLLSDEVAVHDPLAGAIRTDEAVLGATRLAEANGATIMRSTGITAIEPHDNHVLIRSADRSWTFERVVIAAGAWSRELLPSSFADLLTPMQVSLTWFAAREPELFAPQRFPIFMRESEGVRIYGAPSVDNATVKISGVTQPIAVSDAGELRRTPSESELTAINGAVARYFTGLYPYCVRADAYPDLYSEGMVPLIGWLPGMKNVYAATGFSGRGFKMAPAVAESLAREVLFGESEPDVAFASPSRLLVA